MSTPEQRAGLTRRSHVGFDSVKSPILGLDVRQLDAAHLPELGRLLLTLDQPSRLHRFNHSVSDDYLISHARNALSTAAWVAGAFVEERMPGVVEVFDDGMPGFAEAKFAVDPGWHRRGIGSALLGAAIDWAIRSGVPTLRLVFSRSNLPMRRLAAKAGPRLDLAFDEMTAEILLGDASRPRA
jgi:GNAT superfamily N-acetyltransferase